MLISIPLGAIISLLRAFVICLSLISIPLGAIISLCMFEATNDAYISIPLGALIVTGKQIGRAHV